jgi:sacsin
MDSYDGTLFRFPLRTHEQASKSEISKQCYDGEQVMELLELLEKASHHILLYTQSLQKIFVYHLAADSVSPQEMTELFSIERKTERVVRNVFPETHHSTASGFLAKATSLIKAYKPIILHS